MSEKLVLCRRSTADIEEVEHAFIMLWVVGEHVEAGSTDVCLQAGVVVKNVVVDLPCPIGIREMDQPIPPPAGIVDRERADIGGAQSESVEDDFLGCAEPVLLTH